MAASPPLLPSAKVIELTVTDLPAPTFLLLNVDEFVIPNVSDPTRPVRVNVVDAVVDRLYVLLAVDAVAVNTLGTMFPIVDDWSVTL